MRKLIILFIAVSAFLNTAKTQMNPDSTGYDGDHFSLEGALEIFKQSKSPEDFEKRINKESNYVNNLDLNKDGEIDYIKIIDNGEDNFHAIALQVDINEKESQDVAVILIEKTGDSKAILQIIGDEDVFGMEKIVEPFIEELTPMGGKGNSEDDFILAKIVVNVWSWSAVKFVYAPGYVYYKSPWKWSVYPNWWKPWKPHPWGWHYSKRKIHHVHFRPYHSHRIVKAHTFYKPKRKSSVIVKTRTTHTRVVVKKGVQKHHGNNPKAPSKNKRKKKTSVKKGEKTTTVTKSEKGSKVTITSRKKKKSKTKKKGKK